MDKARSGAGRAVGRAPVGRQGRLSRYGHSIAMPTAPGTDLLPNIVTFHKDTYVLHTEYIS